MTLPQQLSQRSSAAQSVSCLSNTPLIIQREREREIVGYTDQQHRTNERERARARDVEMETEIILNNDVGMCGLCNGRTPWCCSPVQNLPTRCGLYGWLPECCLAVGYGHKSKGSISTPLWFLGRVGPAVCEASIKLGFKVFTKDQVISNVLNKWCKARLSL